MQSRKYVISSIGSRDTSCEKQDVNCKCYLQSSRTSDTARLARRPCLSVACRRLLSRAKHLRAECRDCFRGVWRANSADENRTRVPLNGVPDVALTPKVIPVDFGKYNSRHVSVTTSLHVRFLINRTREFSRQTVSVAIPELLEFFQITETIIEISHYDNLNKILVPKIYILIRKL